MEMAGPGGSPEPATAASLEKPVTPPDGVSLDFRALFETAPGVHLVLAPDAPRFTMLAASEERLAATLTTRAETIGRPLFEVFADTNPENAEPSGVVNLRASLETVLRTRAPHRMAVQRYDLRRPDGTWEVRYWAPRNVPVLGLDGAIRYLVHHVEDVTDLVVAREASATAERAHDRTSRLQALTAALAAARTLDDIATVVVADMVVALGAQTGALAGRAPERDAVVLLRTVGFPEPVAVAVQRQADDLASPLTECVRTGSPVWVESRDGVAGLDVRYPRIAPVWDALGLGAAAFVPLVVAGETVGAISFGFGGPRTFDPAERAFLLALGRQAALAVERARLDEAERGTRHELEELLAASEGANARLRAQEQELALANQQLQDQAAELELQAEELQATAVQLEERTEDAERARAEAEDARSAADAANQAKGQFLAVMSHELRTPLNAIGGYAELMAMGIRGPVTAQQREDLGRIQKSQWHLLGLVNEVLNYAKLETGAVHFDLAPVRVGEALAAAEALVAPQARAKALTLVVGRCPPTLVVRADAEKLRQVLVNLLSNAVKFTGTGGRVELACAEDGDRIRLAVRDTGIGIAAAQQERIFEPFVQVRAELTRTAEGTGLGLAISRDLARGMGGDLTAESTPGVGSTFTLTLPAA